jgi:beta-glucosidase
MPRQGGPVGGEDSQTVELMVLWERSQLATRGEPVPEPVPGTPISRRRLIRGTAAVAVTVGLPLLTGCEPTRAEPAEAPLGLTFPPGFRWGAATSAYQVEGAAAEDGRGPSIWDTFSHTPGKVARGDTGDVAADHYHRYREDLDLMKGLGLGSYRFSVSWSRVMPTGSGTVNQAGLDFYKRLVDGLRERGIEPMVTLFHWDLPQALQDRGGWVNRDCAHWFADYAEAVYRGLGDAVPTWLTINEPKTVVDVGYRYGVHAPGVRDDDQAYVAAHHLLLAHGLAVQALRATGSRARIGPALNLAPTYPDPADDAAAAAAAKLADGYENRLYLDPVLKGSYPADVLDDIGRGSPMAAAIRDGDLDTISAKVDLLAVQYYNPVFVSAGGRYVTRLPTSDATWQQIYPDGLYDTLVRLRRDYGDIPITITENGRPSADEPDGDGRVDDPDRIAFLRDHLAAAHRAVAEGVRLESYHVWSLLDNFEWAEGYGQRWGIVYVDYTTQRRIEKSSARWYRGIIARGGV